MLLYGDAPDIFWENIDFMKHTLSGYVEPTAAKLAQKLGFELVDVELVKENTGKFLRFFIDKPEGIDLDALETFHRAVLPLMDDVEYDYMEVCSPGADRPLKKPADFERAKGQVVEVRLYKAVDGLKSFTGELVGLVDGSVVILVDDEERAFPQKIVAQVAPVIELDEEAIDAALGDVFDLEDGEYVEYDETVEFGEEGFEESDEAEDETDDIDE